MSKTMKKQSFFQSIFSLMMSQVIVKVLGLFYRLYLTNRNGFGDEGNAIANAGFQVFALAISIAAIGIPNAISKLVAEQIGRENYKGAYKIFKIALILFSAVGLIGSFSLYAFADLLASNYLHMQEARLSIIALCPSVFLVSIIAVLKGFFSGRQSIKMTAKAQTMDQFIKTITTVIMVELSILMLKINNIEIMSACCNFATTLGNLGEFVYLYKAYIKEKPQIEIELLYNNKSEEIRITNAIKKIMIVAIPLSLSALITTISKNIDSATIVNMLKDIIGYEEAKRQYGILCGKVDALINFPLSFNIAIATTLLPAIAVNSANVKEQNRRIKQSFILGLSIAVPITMTYFFFSDEVLKTLFPNASEGEIILKISSLQILFITIEQISNTTLYGIGDTILPIKAITIGVIAKGILNFILIPKTSFIFGGINGAGIATVICHIIASVISTTGLYKRKKNNIMKDADNNIKIPTTVK